MKHTSWSPTVIFSFHYSTRELSIVASILFFLTVATVVCVGFIPRWYDQVFSPNIYVENIAIGGLSYEEAHTYLSRNLPTPPHHTITIMANEVLVSSDSAQLGITYNIDPILMRAWEVGKQGNRWQRAHTIISSFWKKTQFQLGMKYDQSKLEELVLLLKKQVDNPGKRPQASLGLSGNATTISIDAGEAGLLLDVGATIDVVQTNAGSSIRSFSAVTTQPHTPLNEDQLKLASIRAKQFIGHTILAKAEQAQVSLQDTEILAMLQLPDGFYQEKIDEVVTTIEEKINRPATNAIMEYDPDTLIVSSFLPDKTGLTVQTQKLAATIHSVLAEIEKTQLDQKTENNPDAELNIHELNIPVVITSPQVTLASTNNLGIREIIGHGESEYAHSIPNRVHNVRVTAEKISNHLIAPGTEFSFVKTLGPVNTQTGFKQAHIIRNGRTELGDGGGVCQVSTTLFRALLDGGLKISKRLPHSYRVSYYELDNKPGIDATVYAGEVDLRFINDTQHYVLLSAQTDDKNMAMSVTLYGTSDGRTTQLIDHVTSNYRPPPPPEYFPDPSLPSGSLRQIDQARAGIRATFSNVIYDANGNILRKDDYVSNYRPWSAKYLQGV